MLFNTTIKNNILLGKPDASDAEVEAALRSTNAWGFVSNQPQGIHTEAGAGGS